MANVCFLGMGKMGFGMASRLLKAGNKVRVYNRTKDKTTAIVNLGATTFETPKQAAEGADILFAMVGDDSASQAVWLDENGALTADVASNAIVVECSTISHDWVIKLSNIVRDKGLSYLDCPVTGLPNVAANGELTLFLGGKVETIARAQPFLDAISLSQVHFGDVGAGAAYKLIVNLIGSIQIAATAEGLLVAEKVGLDLNKVASALAIGGAGSPNVARNSKMMAESAHVDDVLFNAKWRLKDTCYGVRLAKKMKQQVALGEVAEHLFQKLVDAGYSQYAESKIIDVLRD